MTKHANRKCQAMTINEIGAVSYRAIEEIEALQARCASPNERRVVLACFMAAIGHSFKSDAPKSMLQVAVSAECEARS